MNEISPGRRVSPIADLDREQIKELCELHPLEMGQLCAKVGLNKSVLSNFLAGRRPFPQKFAPTFLRQIGLNVKGEIDPRHCFYLTVGPGLEDLAAKWIKRLFPLGGTMCIVYKNMRSDDPEEGEYRVEAGVALTGGELVAVVRDDVNFGDFAWIPGVWETGNSINADDLLDVTRLPAKKDVLAAMASVPTYDNMIWGEVQRVAEAAGLTGDEVLRIVEDAIRGFSESPQRRDAFDVEGRKAEATRIAAIHSLPENSAFRRSSGSLVADKPNS
ncbi:hypothetical protein [Polaromonas naphthalenivorans]|uniref:Uncharacterized protein n=1 Tax=Polaromonas naphthalenivorans (strain CJ2) TaxID=365044 RepID=A1VVQ4_POLNA|nr:hypothetical protein [Polaromonas naphthalenivorans]ABM39732.1 hypothetical protein Pnap_4456 [Polaromonas naphthalenivorans CJ2]